MSAPVRIHIHPDPPNRTLDQQGEARIETLCEEYRREEKVVPIDEYRRWVTDLGKTMQIFCGHCRSAL